MHTISASVSKSTGSPAFSSQSVTRNSAGVRAAEEMLRQHRKPIVDKVAYWSGVQRPIIKRLVEAICKRVEELGLRVDVRHESEYLTEFTVYTTALAMNYLLRGKFTHP